MSMKPSDSSENLILPVSDTPKDQDGKTLFKVDDKLFKGSAMTKRGAYAAVSYMSCAGASILLVQFSFLIFCFCCISYLWFLYEEILQLRKISFTCWTDVDLLPPNLHRNLSVYLGLAFQSLKVFKFMIIWCSCISILSCLSCTTLNLGDERFFFLSVNYSLVCFLVL